MPDVPPTAAAPAVLAEREEARAARTTSPDGAAAPPHGATERGAHPLSGALGALAPLLARADRLLAQPVTAVLGWLSLVYPCWIWSVSDGHLVSAFDASVYFGAVRSWAEGGSLYDWYALPVLKEYPFTYPPFAACALRPLTVLGEAGTQLALTALTAICTTITLWALLRGLGAETRRARGLAPWLALLACLFLEPFRETLYEGQVNAVLMALVAVDLVLVREPSRWRGALSALAACFKLTPAVSGLVLLARREYRAAAMMVGTAVWVTALVWLASPADSWRFFTSAMLDTSRTGFAEFAGNQSLKGTIARLAPESAWVPLWAVCAAAVLIGAWFLLRRLNALRAQDDGLVLELQLVVTMMMGLLVSPVSWTHHWVWCAPALLVLAVASWRWRSWWLGGVTLLGAVILGTGIQWSFPFQNHVELSWPLWMKIVGAGYVWWALLAGAALWLVAGRHAQARTALTRPGGRRAPALSAPRARRRSAR